MRVFVNGENSLGELTIDNNIKGTEEDEFIEIKLNFKIKQIACGYGHVLFLSKNNELYGCGGNSNGELSLKTRDYKCKLTQIDTTSILSNNNNEEIKTIVCGGYFSALLTTKNNLFLTGQGACGQLGFGDLSDKLEFTKSNFNFGKIKSVKCGTGTTIILNENGQFYLSGSTIYKSFDSNNNKFITTITKFQPFYCNSNIIDFYCGDEHAIFLDKFGKLFFLSRDEEKVIYWPTNFKIKQIASGYQYFTVLSEENELYFTFNSNSLKIEEKNLQKIELNKDNIKVKKLFSGLHAEFIYFTSTRNTVCCIVDNDEVKELDYFNNKVFSEKFIYPIAGYGFVYVIVSNDLLFEECDSLEKMFQLLLFKQQQQLGNAFCDIFIE